MSHVYKFQRGDRVRIISGMYAGASGTVDTKVFQYSVNYPEELGMSYHVVLDAGQWVTVRVEQVTLSETRPALAEWRRRSPRPGWRHRSC